ncbi:MAG: DNA primase [Chloroflexi bacterium]|nr:DNA primase [Chloroflexota bacterium]
MNISEEVKQRLDIVNVIGDHVQLGKSGRNFRGLCPFHTEKTPSFFVFPDRQTWRCFGCGTGGDVISFVMKREGLSFGEALKSLAQRTGVPLPEKKVRSAEEEDRLSKLYRINEAAAQYFNQLLLASAAAEAARSYVKKRGLAPETVQEFLLGYSLNEWDGLKQHLKKQGYTEAEAVAAGLAVQNEEGRIWDRFRGRLMFAIRNASGHVIGFGARALDDSMPKYLNSAESAVFSKSAVLYGLDRAKEAIRGEGKVVIVEGYMDALAAHQYGFRNVIASMGTALTEKQIAMLKGLTSHICLALDPDAAGNAATLRGIEICRQALERGARPVPNLLGGSTELRAQISIISLPDGKDPDEVIRENPDEWKKRVNEAQPLMDYLFTIGAQKLDLARTEGKTQLVDQFLPLIAEMKDGVEREVYLGKLSRLAGLSERVLAGKAAQLFAAKQSKPRRKQAAPSEPVIRKGDAREERCLSLLLKHPWLRPLAQNLSPDHFEYSENREILVLWQRGRNPEALQEDLDPVLKDHIQMLINIEQPPSDREKQEQELNEYILGFEERKLKAALEAGEDVERNSAMLAEVWRRRAALGRR